MIRTPSQVGKRDSQSFDIHQGFYELLEVGACFSVRGWGQATISSFKSWLAEQGVLQAERSFRAPPSQIEPTFSALQTVSRDLHATCWFSGSKRKLGALVDKDG